jgi:phage gpG-like protein
MSDVEVKVVRDEISPDLERMARALSGPQRRQVLRAMGAEAVAITQGAFKNAALRPLPWPPLKYRTGMPLIKTQQLLRGIHISALDSDSVTIQPSVFYAIYHQLGARKAHIPPRSFFPFDLNGRVTPLGARRIEEVARAAIERMLRRS